MVECRDTVKCSMDGKVPYPDRLSVIFKMGMNYIFFLHIANNSPFFPLPLGNFGVSESVLLHPFHRLRSTTRHGRRLSAAKSVIAVVDASGHFHQNRSSRPIHHCRYF